MEESNNANVEVQESQTPQETSGLAVAALICGIIGLCTFLPGLVAIILGIIALSEIKTHQKGGKGMAITGIILGSITILFFILVPIIAAIAIPGVLSARTRSNEGSVIATLRTICTSQAQFQSMCLVDQDKDGTGEFGFLQELSGASNLRGGDRPADPAYITRALAPNLGGIAQKSGYCFYMYLPTNADFSNAMGEDEMKFNADIADAQEMKWICYAWPITYPSSGRRVFVIDQAAEVFSMENTGGIYSGANKPAFNAAFGKDGYIQPGIGKDGNEWRSASY